MHTILQPDGWISPAGYSYGIAARGRFVFLGGQIGWNRHHQFETDDLVGQVRQTLHNVVEVLAEAAARPRHLTLMTWYFTDMQEYLAHRKQIGPVYRELIGNHYPAMAAVEVAALIDGRAKVEIQAVAVVPD